ncbi:MAG: ATP-binding protein [Alphaproteobacteria bacterium]|jgi:two-component system osmolarity sensor histidine kinase EnvZ|nr:ATP-binding protein [Alphaproteobacteria bacterium]MDP6567270.1 ATP-binding protein [Alphaproteobacteria bacterium]MDP6811700.1 ATP-binding protein [Alphaproteobacteria bacterium]
MLKRFLPRSLFGRAIIIIIAPVVLLQVVAAIVFFDRHLESVTRRMARSVAGDISFVTAALSRNSESLARFRILQSANRRLNLNFTLLAEQPLTAGPLPTGGTPIEALLIRTIDEGLELAFTIENQPAQKHYLIRVAFEDGTLQVLVPHNRVTAAASQVLALWTIGSSLLLLAIAILFLRNQVRPILRLAQAADRLGKGQEVEDFKPSGASEVRLAADAFLRMRDRIERQIRQRTEMLAGVSHDLRTPLTRMKLELAMLGETPAAAEMQADVEEMERMIEGYLAFARGADGERAVETDLTQLLEETVGDARRHGAEVDFAAEGELRARLRPQSLKRCVANLLSNAERYARRTSVEARRDGDMIEITVDDDGPGIPEAEREAVFRPFYRLEGSRNPGTGGVGLGLAIARDTVRSQGGDVTLGEAPAGGLRATVRLPV